MSLSAVHDGKNDKSCKLGGKVQLHGVDSSRTCILHLADLLQCPLGVRHFRLAMRPCVSFCREDVAELMKDDLYVVRYNPIKDLLRDDWVELV